MRQLFVFDPPDRFVTGTVGEPGQRVFFLQARDGDRLVTVQLEKVQVEALASRIDEMVAELRRRGVDVPLVVPAELDDRSPLDTPIEPSFVVGLLAIAWDGERDRFVVEAQEASEELEAAEPDVLDDGPDGPDTLRVSLTLEGARAFADRAVSVVAAGRAECLFCGEPMDPQGHVCPRSNGHGGT